MSSQPSTISASTYYVVPCDGADFKCYECGRVNSAKKNKFVKITGLFGARHAARVEDLDQMTEIPYPGEFNP